MSERKDVTFHSYPKLNYLFITGERKSSPTEYRTPGNVDAEVVGDIATWVLARKK